MLFTFWFVFATDCIKIPVSNTCIRLVTTKQLWTDAKADCESKGQNLLKLDTAAKDRWFHDQLKYAGTGKSVLSTGKMKVL